MVLWKDTAWTKATQKGVKIYSVVTRENAVVDDLDEPATIFICNPVWHEDTVCHRRDDG